jgi:hypothetical protein
VSDGGDDAPEPECFDESFEPTDTCLVEPNGTACGDPTDACSRLDRIVVSPDAEGICLRLFTVNECSETLHSVTCFEHEDASWECYQSITTAGMTLELYACEATGRYVRWNTTDRPELDVLTVECDPR